MLDRFDLALLDRIQRDDSQTAEQLAKAVALSPSAIARRLRRLRSDGWIARTVAILADRLIEQRLRALVFIELAEHADLSGKVRLQQRIQAVEQIQFCYETAGEWDMVVLFDCATMSEFNTLCDSVLTADPTVRRYETSFIKRGVKFAPFVRLSEKA
jgi:Lrp/AsnC family leucine-responsive transcriptional regulator